MRRKGTASLDEERYDIYDEQMNPIGIKTKTEVHREGYWHKTFQCWMVRMDEEVAYILFQLRHPTKAIFPNKLDKSAAGHLIAGETVAQGVREIEEELGIHVPFDHLSFCGIIPLENETESGLIDREFCHVFTYRCDLPLEAYQMQPDEVSGLFYVSVNDFYQLVYGSKDRCQAQGIIAVGNGRYERQVTEVTIDSFTPQSEHYYEVLFQHFRQQGWLTHPSI